MALMESISSVESKTVTSPYFIKNYLEETKSLCELEKGLTMLLSNDVSIWKSDVAFLKFFCFFRPIFTKTGKIFQNIVKLI